MVCMENILTKNIWVNSFTAFKTFEKGCSNFNFRQATLVAFVFRESYKKFETASESLYFTFSKGYQIILISQGNLKNKFSLNGFKK